MRFFTPVCEGFFWVKKELGIMLKSYSAHNIRWRERLLEIPAEMFCHLKPLKIVSFFGSFLNLMSVFPHLKQFPLIQAPKTQ
jgi:hypothetical protein